jgi:hypothetical protein
MFRTRVASLQFTNMKGWQHYQKQNHERLAMLHKALGQTIVPMKTQTGILEFIQK